MAIPGKFEIAPGAELTDDPLAMTWVDLTTRTRRNAVTIRRGRSSSNAQRTEAAGMPIDLDNSDGALTRGKAGTTPSYYPNIDLGLVARHYMNTGARYLACTGASGSDATTPDAASWNLGADAGIAIQFRSPVRIPPSGFTYQVAGQFTIAGGQRSWLVYLSASGIAGLRVSSNGTSESDSLTSLPIPRPDAGPLTIGLEFDGDNGASGNTTTWYVLKDTITALLADKASYLFGDADTNSGTITLHNSTGTVGVGDVPGSGFLPYPGGIEALYVRAGTLTSGTVVGNPDFTTQTAGAGSFVDTAGTPKTWTVNSPAAITDRKVTITGQVASMERSYPAQSTPGTAQTHWTVAGPLRRMRQGDPKLRSALYRRVTAPVNNVTVYAYFPCEDERDATEVFSPIGGNPGGIMSMNLAGDDTLNASAPLPTVSAGQPYGWNLAFDPDAPTTGWEGTWLMKLPTQPAGSEFVDQRIDTIGGTTSEWVFRMDSAGYILFAKDRDKVNVLSDATGFISNMYGSWDITTLFLTQNGANIDWSVEFIPLDGSGIVIGSSGTLAGYTLGHPVRYRSLSTAAPTGGLSIGHMMITTGATAGWLAPADTAYAGEPAPQRAFRLCQEQGQTIFVDGPYGTDWDAAIAAGAQPMGPQLADQTLLGYLDEAALVDNGSVGEARDYHNALTFRSGSTLVNQPARITLTDEVTSPLKPTSDDKDFVNEAVVTRKNGSSATYTATGRDHPDVKGLYDDSRTINCETDADTLPHAAWWVHESTWPEERYDEIPVELAKNTALIDDWLAFSPGDVLEATALPDEEAATELFQIIDGWTETISPHLWTVKASARPAGPWTGLGTFDDDTPTTSLARLDTDGDTTTLTGSLNSSATGGQSVTISSGPLWTTSASYFPLDILIDGEQITLSGISGGASPQTFTISARSVNGVVASHSAGAAIRPATPFRLARTKGSP